MDASTCTGTNTDYEGLIITISGGIGAGKTTLGQLLADELDAVFYQEPVNVALLNQFLTDPKQYAYAFQLYMLTRRQLNYALALENKKHGITTVIDRSLRCDKVFADLQHHTGSITDDEIAVYDKVFADFEEFKPDVVLHLEASIDTLMQRIQRRGRDGESAYTREYLTQLTAEYDRAVEELEKKKIKVCKLDWNNHIDLNDTAQVRDMLDNITERILNAMMRE